MQSAYRANFSTETPLMKLQNDILSAFDVRRGVLVVLLDRTAAFDTVDHEGLLRLLQSRFHLSGVASPVDALIPHWMVISCQHSRKPLWAMESQFRSPTGVSLGSRSIYCVYLSSLWYHTKAWPFLQFMQMIFNYIQPMTLALQVMSASQHLSNIQLVIGDQIIPLSTEVTNLGVSLDSSCKLSAHVQHIVRTCNFHLRNLRRIRRFIDMKTCNHAVLALIISRLDYCNG